MHKDICTLRR